MFWGKWKSVSLSFISLPTGLKQVELRPGVHHIFPQFHYIIGFPMQISVESDVSFEN